MQWRISRRGGASTSYGGAYSRGSYVLKIWYVETKESGPLGACTGHGPLDPPMGMQTCFVQLGKQINESRKVTQK